MKSCSLKNSISNISFFILVLISILFTSVSSGTFMVSILTLLIFYFTIMIIHFPILKIKYIYLQIYTFLVIILLTPLIVKFIDKNLQFFNGSIIEMLGHGFGRYLEEYYILFFIDAGHFAATYCVQKTHCITFFYHSLCFFMSNSLSLGSNCLNFAQIYKLLLPREPSRKKRSHLH